MTRDSTPEQPQQTVIVVNVDDPENNRHGSHTHTHTEAHIHIHKHTPTPLLPGTICYNDCKSDHVSNAMPLLSIHRSGEK